MSSPASIYDTACLVDFVAYICPLAWHSPQNQYIVCTKKDWCKYNVEGCKYGIGVICLFIGNSCYSVKIWLAVYYSAKSSVSSFVDIGDEHGMKKQLYKLTCPIQSYLVLTILGKCNGLYSILHAFTPQSEHWMAIAAWIPSTNWPNLTKCFFFIYWLMFSYQKPLKYPFKW